MGTYEELKDRAALVCEILAERGWIADDSGCWQFPGSYVRGARYIGCQDDVEDLELSRLGPWPPVAEFDQDRLLLSGPGSEHACDEHAIRHEEIPYSELASRDALDQLARLLERVEKQAVASDHRSYVQCFVDGPCGQSYERIYVDKKSGVAARRTGKV